MNNEVRQILCDLIVQYGHSICNDPYRCKALLNDCYSISYKGCCHA